VGGILLVGVAAYYLTHPGPLALGSSGKSLGFHIWNTGANLSIAGVVGGTALTSLAILMIINQFLQRRTVVTKIWSANLSEDAL